MNAIASRLGLRWSHDVCRLLQLSARAGGALALCGLAASSAVALSSIEEHDLGQRFSLEARATLPLLEDPEVVAYVTRLGERIAAATGSPTPSYEFTVVRDDRVNAFAVPGGFVYLNAGLLVRAATDDEVAGVLGHEIAHIQARHLARQQEKTQALTYATLAALALSAIQPAIGVGALAASAAAQLKYQRDFEQEADYLGARYMSQAKFDAGGMLDFFKRLEAAHGGAVPLIPPYLQSHPLTQERLNNLEAVLRQRQWAREQRRAASLDLQRVRVVVRGELEPTLAVVADYRARAEAARDDGTAHYLLGIACLRAGQLAEAGSAFESARERDFHGIDRELGRVALAQRKLDEAIVHLRAATAADAGDAVAFRDLGRALEARGDVAAAIDAYATAVGLAPRMADAHYNLGILAGRAGEQGRGFYHLGWAMQLRGSYEQALNYDRQAEAGLPSDAPERDGLRARMASLEQYLNPSFFGR